MEEDDFGSKRLTQGFCVSSCCYLGFYLHVIIFIFGGKMLVKGYKVSRGGSSSDLLSVVTAANNMFFKIAFGRVGLKCTHHKELVST